MAEMIIPGTYVTVRSEGLISAGRVATGIVGVVGTAARGEIGVPFTLSGLAEARERFGAPDDFARPEDGAHPLTLVRALEHVYGNGAATVVAVRVAGAARASATFAVQDAASHTVAVLTARTPGSWGNGIQVVQAEAEEHCRVEDDVQESGFTRLAYARVVPSEEARIRVFRGITQRSATLDVRYRRAIEDEEVVPFGTTPVYRLATPPQNVAAVNRIVVTAADGTETVYTGGNLLYDSTDAPGTGQVDVATATGVLRFGTAPPAGATVLATYAAAHTPPAPGQVLVTTWDGSLAFAAGEAPDEANGDRLIASYLVDRRDCTQVELEHEAVRVSFTAPDGRLLARLVNAGSPASALVTAEPDPVHGGGRPRTGVGGYFGTGSNTPGGNGAEAAQDEYAAGLESLANELVNIVVLAGQQADRALGPVLEAHLNATDQTDHERIGVIGAPGATLAEFLGHTVASDRIVVVAPGLALAGGRRLPTGYAAAAVAGALSSLPVQTSLTNRTVTVPDLDLRFNRGQQAQLIRRNVLALVEKNGFRVLKGITSAGEGTPFSAIPTRRIVDYAKYGVRSAANPYLGRLNNARVRGALQATLEAFLARMVDDEALTGFELQVSATRAQEIAGEVSVAMTLHPVFSIDYIRVTMNLS